MQISQHYSPYADKTLIVLTNNDTAKLYHAHEREVEEILVMEVDPDFPENEHGQGAPNAGEARVDEIKKQSRHAMYSDLNTKLMGLMKDGYVRIVLCAPKVHKNDILGAMHTDVQTTIGEVIPKNLAMLPLDQVIRILQESHRM